MDSTNINFSQRMISRITDVLPSVVSRYISTNDIKPAVINNKLRKKYDLETTRRLVKMFGFDDLVPKEKLQVFFNFKGGTGKTSICYQISNFFSLCGFNVLVIDCDPQAHLTYSLGLDIYGDNKTLYDIIVNNLKFQDAIQTVYPGLDCIPSNISLTRLELPLNQMTNREKIFSKLIDPIKNKYDFIFIDTNPTISILNRNVTLAADTLNIVCETQPLSLKGLEILFDEIKAFSEAMDTPINIKVIANKYESKTATSQEALGILRVDYKEYLMNSVVRRCEDINISSKRKEPVIFWASKSSVALEDITDLAKEMICLSTTNNKDVIR